ncbi:MAG TPA: zf-HC2 domain-containing protein [Longimicrobiales bacterium]|nr:zf-HC2 domain-containing protein [Longimicrobiales bacterium]
MNCTTFLENFSSWVDGDVDPPLRDRLNAHVAGCEECQKYEEVYHRGTQLLRAMHEDLDVDEDVFRSSLEHRILRGRRRAGEANTIGSGAPFVSLLAMTVVVLSVAWIPVLMVLTEPTVELAPMAAERPAPRRALQPVALPAVELAGRPGGNAIRTVPLEIRGTVPRASDLMRQYAPVLQSYRAGLIDGID